MVTLIDPPTPPQAPRLLPLYRLAAHLSFGGGLLLTLSASTIMVGSAALSSLAGAALTAGERLREQAERLLAVGHPAAAVAFRARKEFYARRRQGVALD